ncbi:hypothetical protein ACHAXN_012063 [Cyclotella atomus]
MALRPLGVYLLTGSALYTQTKTTYHLTEMTTLAAKSTSLTLLAAGEEESALALQREAAIDSEDGLEKQSESIELEASSEREHVKAAEQTLLAEKYKEEAEALHAESVKDKAESESAFEESEELETLSEQANIESGQDLAAAETYEEQSAFEFDEAAKAEKLAEEAEARAAKDESVVVQKEAASAKDAESLTKTETGAIEDAEAIASCEVIPVLNVFCDIAGAITEAGLQSVAAVEAAKSAVESITAATWSGKEREELLATSNEHAEAARDAVEGSKFHALSIESSEKSIAEKADSVTFHESELNAKGIAEEKLAASEEEESMSKFDEEEASRHSAEAAEHEALATEEEAAATTSQLESEERLDQSTAEEFESQYDRMSAKSNENEARKLLEQSISHGIQALWFVLSSILTAVGVIYVVSMKTLTKRAIPTVLTLWRGEHDSTSFDLFRAAAEVILHASLVFGVIATLPSSFSNFADLSTWSRWKELINMAVFVGITESILIYSLSEMCCCQMKGRTANVTAASSGTEFFGKSMLIIPTVLIELLIVLTLCGPDVFDHISSLSFSPYLVWGAILPFVTLYMWHFRLKSVQVENATSSSHKSISSGWDEDEFAYGNGSDSLIGTSIDKEYGSMEEVSLLSATKQTGDNSLTVNSQQINAEDSTSDTISISYYFQRLHKDLKRACSILHNRLDLLAIVLMTMLLYRSSPVIKILHPVAAKSFAALDSLLSTPVLVGGIISAAAIVHFVFIY